MAPKKKKKSGKLAKMSEEERIMYMEQQRLAEEEMRKKKEDMLTQFLKVSPQLYKEKENQRLSVIYYRVTCTIS